MTSLTKTVDCSKRFLNKAKVRAKFLGCILQLHEITLLPATYVVIFMLSIRFLLSFRLLLLSEYWDDSLAYSSKVALFLSPQWFRVVVSWPNVVVS